MGDPFLVSSQSGWRGLPTTTHATHPFLSDNPLSSSTSADVVVRPLGASHLAKVKHFWPYLQDVPDAEPMLQRSVETELSAGVFLPPADDAANSDSGVSADSGDSANCRDSSDGGDLNVAVDSADSLDSNGFRYSGDSGGSGESTESSESVNSVDSGVDSAPLPADRLVSWILINAGGYLGFAHTVQEQRRRGFARLALTELTRRCARRQLPAVIATQLHNGGMVGAMRPLNFTAVHDVFWAAVAPTPPPLPPPPAAPATQTGVAVQNTTGA